MASLTAPPLCPLDSFSARDRQSFRAVQKLYEERKYNKAAKQLETLIKKYPNCLEALSLKCLICRNIPGRKEEGLSAVKLALHLDLKNAVAWHAMGSFYKMENDFAQALISFRQAAAWDNNNIQILVDLSLIQLHLEQYQGFLQTRQRILRVKNDSKIHWYAVPFAMHLNGQPLAAADLLLRWWSFPPEILGQSKPQWETELRLYFITLLEEGQDYERALAHVTNHLAFENSKDRVGALTIKGRLELRLRKFDDAKKTYRQLIDTLPENNDYLFGYVVSHPEFHVMLPSPFDCDEDRMKLYPDILTNCGVRNPEWTSEPLSFSLKASPEILDRFGRTANLDKNHLHTAWNRGTLWSVLHAAGGVEASIELQQKLCSLFWELQEEIGHAVGTIRGFAICLLRDESLLRRSVNDLLFKKIGKGSVACLVMADHLLKTTEERKKIILSVLDEIAIEHSSNGNVIPQIFLDVIKARESLKQIPPNLPSALQAIDQAISQIPTCVELIDIKVTMLFECGKFEEASKLAEQNRKMDSADRYLNDRSVKAQLRAGKFEEAMKIAKSFNKQAENKEKIEAIDTQNFSQEMCYALSYRDIGCWREAAERLDLICSRYDTIKNEALDFYLYCLRRGALRAFCDFLAVQRKLKSHTYCVRASLKLVELYSRKHDGLLPPSTREVSEKLRAEPWPIRSTFNWETETPLKEAETLLNELRSECPGLGTFQINQQSYLLHTRQTHWKPEIVVQSLYRLYRLADKQIDHPKLFPYLLHYIASDGQERTGDAGKEFSRRLNIQSLKAVDYLNAQMDKHIRRRDRVPVCKDVLALMKGVALLSSSSLRGRGVIDESQGVTHVSLQSLWKEVASLMPSLKAGNSMADILRCERRWRREEQDMQATCSEKLDSWETISF